MMSTLPLSDEAWKTMLARIRKGQKKNYDVVNRTPQKRKRVMKNINGGMYDCYSSRYHELPMHVSPDSTNDSYAKFIRDHVLLRKPYNPGIDRQLIAGNDPTHLFMKIATTPAQFAAEFQMYTEAICAL